MTKYIYLFLFSVLLVGCAPNRALKHFEKDELYAKSLQYTNKCDILSDNQLKIMLTATYLNSVDSKWNDENENFIVGVYVVETNENNEAFYLNEKFELLLNETNYKSIEPLTKNNEMFNNMPLNNAWADYFFVKYNPVDIAMLPIQAKLLNNTNKNGQQKEEIPVSYDLKLKLNHTTLGSCALSFLEE